MLASTHSPLDLTVVFTSGRWRVTGRGELDLSSGPDVVAAAGVLCTAGAAAVDFDLADISFVDTSGWSAVVEARGRIEKAGADTALVALSPAVTRLVGLLETAGAAC